MCLCAKSLQSCPSLCDPLDCTCQAPLSMGFSRQEYWSGLSCPPAGNLPDPESLASPALAGRFFTTSATWEALSQWQPLSNKNGFQERMGEGITHSGDWHRARQEVVLCILSVYAAQSSWVLFLQRTRLIGLHQCTLSKCQKIRSRETINHVSSYQDSTDAVWLNNGVNLGGTGRSLCSFLREACPTWWACTPHSSDYTLWEIPWGPTLSPVSPYLSSEDDHTLGPRRGPWPRSLRGLCHTSIIAGSGNPASESPRAFLELLEGTCLFTR